MYNVGQIVVASFFGGKIIMKVQTEYTIELPCELVFRVQESEILRARTS